MTFPIAATADYAARVAARDHTAVAASLRPFFEPRSVAVLGASPRRGTIGGELFRNILAGDFSGASYPINRSGESVAGVRGYASIDDVPDEVDLAVVCVPAVAVLEAAESALRKGVRALVVISAGFAEVGAEGARAAAPAARPRPRSRCPSRSGRTVLASRPAATRLNATFASRQAPSGNIGFSSQSGALGLAMLEAAESRGLGLSAFVSIGNKADVSSNDLLEWWEDDPRTEVVLLYVESFGNPRKFAELARRVARSKPILAVKSGRTASGARAASSHTAALAGSEAAVDALFHQAGVIRAGSLEELVDVATLLSIPAGAAWPRRGGADQCRRTRDHVRRRLRGGRPDAAAARRRDTQPDSRHSCRLRQVSRTRSTCSAPRLQLRTRRCCRSCSTTRPSTRSSSYSFRQ